MPQMSFAGIEQLRPWAVDVSSGVESSRGVKDAAAIRRFCDAVREADARSPHPPHSLIADRPSTSCPNYQQPDASGPLRPLWRQLRRRDARPCARRAEGAATPRPDATRRSTPSSAPNSPHFVGRPSPIYHAARLSRELGGAQIYLKREDLNHTGAHKINNTIGQAMLARRMGKPRVIAETGAGQHGVATATICARYGLECVVYMGSEDVKRQAPNVYRMNLLGATVVPVESGSKTLKDALNEALRDWVTNVENTFYIIGTVAGPHPYPTMVRDFQRVIGDECLSRCPR